MEQKQKHLAALDRLVEQVKPDPNVIALLLSGSLAYGTVWEKSDIDLTLIVRDNAGLEPYAPDYCLEEDGIEIHLALDEISSFKHTMRKQRGGQGVHSYLGLGRLVFSKDDSLYDFFEETRTVGGDDTVLSFIDVAEMLIAYMNRAEKWVTVFRDPLYAQRFLSACAMYMGELIVLLHGEDPNREAILRAMELEPEVMGPVYQRPYSGRMTCEEVLDVVRHCDDFLMAHVQWWSAPLLRYLEDGQPRRVSQFIRHFGVSGMFGPLAYLAQKGVLVRVTQPARVFKHSRFTLEEVSYMYIKEEEHA